MRLFVDKLTNLDFSYLDADRGLVGETWLANIELIGGLDEQGMVCDFGDVKKKMRHWLDTHIDHKLLIPADSDALTFSQQEDVDQVEWRYKQGVIKSTAPSQAHSLITGKRICAETVANWAMVQLKALFPASIDKLTLSFSIEHIEGPSYHYSHGLKKHGGNCQRIAHGHRSKIEIWQNGEYADALMTQWAQNWRDIYIGSESDCEQDPSLPDNYLFSYEAMQGFFSLSLPKSACYLIPTETTVELISEHLASRLKSENTSSAFRVKAFEGIGKGAISEA